MRICPDLADMIGNTPLIRLRQASEATGCEILGKAEFMNPGQSVKDRAALYIIKDAVARGELRPGGTVVEGTAGNTGIGLALVQELAGRPAAALDAADMQRLETEHRLFEEGVLALGLPEATAGSAGSPAGRTSGTGSIPG